ncbi:MAG TPA: hypothetical protein VMH89_01400 [Candidatus Acidoferrum sp.]|nr:hypothetical protein [Candidatus Acidoferrum sp.]
MPLKARGEAGLVEIEAAEQKKFPLVQQYLETPRLERGVAGLGGSIAGGRTGGVPLGAAENDVVEQEVGERCGEIRRRSDNSPSQRHQHEANVLSLHNAD